MMEFQQYIHNKGQQGLLQAELIKQLNSKIKSMEEIATINKELNITNDKLIKQQAKVIRIQEEQYEAMKKLAFETPTFWENAMSGGLWKKK